jgi:hypothetical protein
MAINPNVDFVSGAILTAAQQNRFPRGIMGYTTKTSNFTVTTTTTDVGLSVTYTAVASRYYKYTFYCYAADADANVFTIEVTDSSNVVKYNIRHDADGPTQFGFQVLTYISTESAGSVTRKVRAKTSTGGGIMYADATNVMYLLVEDIGPA